VTVLTRFDRRLFVAWLIVATITLGYLGVDRAADHGGRLVASTAVTVSAICLALVKARIILREFMDVRHAPPLLCRLTDLLLVVMAAALLGSYVVGKAVA
jgi:Prokaryotic Cytochrome C oxidase subunit IV